MSPNGVKLLSCLGGSGACLHGCQRPLRSLAMRLAIQVIAASMLAWPVARADSASKQG